jgi:hypothetical protein
LVRSSWRCWIVGGDYSSGATAEAVNKSTHASPSRLVIIIRQDSRDGQPAPVFLEPFPHPRELAQTDRPGLHAPRLRLSLHTRRYVPRISPMPANCAVFCPKYGRSCFTNPHAAQHADNHVELVPTNPTLTCCEE